MKRNFNPFALLGLVGLIGIIGLLIGRENWFPLMAWFYLFSYYNSPLDERFKKNISKAGLPSFAITFLGLMVLYFMKDLGVPQHIIYSGIDFVYTIGFLSFGLVLKYFEVYGE